MNVEKFTRHLKCMLFLERTKCSDLLLKFLIYFCLSFLRTSRSMQIQGILHTVEWKNTMQHKHLHNKTKNTEFSSVVVEPAERVYRQNNSGKRGARGTRRVTLVTAIKVAPYFTHNINETRFVQRCD